MADLQLDNNYFTFNDSEKLEDVDDNDFLKNSRLRSNDNGNDTSGQQHYAQKRREIEERSLQSTQRSLGLLYDTEEVGTSTAAKLAKQREQLERTNKTLDDMNASLRYSQRHLNGIKSVFGSIRNYFSGGNRDATSITNERKMSTGSQISPKVEGAAGTLSKTAIVPPTNKYDQHPISILREDSKRQLVQSQQTEPSHTFEQQLESNLNEMSTNLSRLKGLASDLGAEIESQNELLDNMNYKIEDVDLKLSKQNKDIAKLLGKK